MKRIFALTVTLLIGVGIGTALPAADAGQMKRPAMKKFYVTGVYHTEEFNDCTLPAIETYGTDRLDALTRIGMTVWTEEDWHKLNEYQSFHEFCKDRATAKQPHAATRCFDSKGDAIDYEVLYRLNSKITTEERIAPCGCVSMDVNGARCVQRHVWESRKK